MNFWPLKPREHNFRGGDGNHDRCHPLPSQKKRTPPLDMLLDPDESKIGIAAEAPGAPPQFLDDAVARTTLTTTAQVRCRHFFLEVTHP